MNMFPENYCRICSDFFCCVNCRLKHEVDTHGIHPECNICIYGKAFLKKTSNSLLQHYKEAHWPLHCIFCKVVFTSVRDLVLHNICPMAKMTTSHGNNSDIVFAIPYTTTEENYESPPITSTMHKSILTSSNKYYIDHPNRMWLTTSTPMQNVNDRELLQHTIPEIITPVDYSEKTNTYNRIQSINASSINSVTSEQSKDAEPPLKRRVTFSDIEIIGSIETPYQNRKTKYIPSYEIKQQFCATPGSSTKPINKDMYSQNELKDDNTEDDLGKLQMFVTAYDEGVGDTPKISTNHEHKSREETHSLGTTTNDDAEWQSALMESNVSTVEAIINSPIEDVPAVLKANLTEPNILPHAIKSDVISPIQNQTSIELENQNIHSRMMLVPENVTDSSITSVAVNNSSLSDFKLTKSELVSPETEKNVKESFLFNTPENYIKSETNLEMCIPLTKHFVTETLSPDAASNSEYSDIYGATSSMNISISQKSGIWSSMTNIFKTMVKGLSNSAAGNEGLDSTLNEHIVQCSSAKRSKPEMDTSISESPKRKRIKLTHIQCRRTIRNVRPFYELHYGERNIHTNDKSTQTDEC